MTLSEKLTAAEAAYHDLLTGASPRVVVDQNGERVEYTPANRGALAAYISDLKRQISPTVSRGPARIWI